MSYQQGYPQQQPQGAWQGGGGYPMADSGGSGGTNPAVAIIAGVLGVVAAAALVVANVDFLDQLGNAGLGDLPSEFMIVFIGRFAAAAVLLIGAIIVFFRKLPGAIILAIGGLLGTAAILLYPVLLGDVLRGLDFGTYFEGIFKFDRAEWTFSVVALIASPLALIFSILPPTLNYLKGSPASSYEGYPQQQGW